MASLIKEIILKIDSSWPNHVRIRDEIINDIAFESFPFRLDGVTWKTKDETREWVNPAKDYWDLSNLGEAPVTDVYWFMAKGASNNVAQSMGLYNIWEIALWELANMPLKTSTAFHSKIVFGTSKDSKRIALILNVHLEGL